MQVPVVAYYWNGGVPTSYEVRHINPGGAFVVTHDRWYLGTIVAMKFQYDPYYLQVAKIAGSESACIHMRAKIMRCDPDGVAVRFIYLNSEERHRFYQFLNGAEVRGET